MFNRQFAVYAREDSQSLSRNAVINANNTSRFVPKQPDGVVAIYKLNTAYEQVQEIAYSIGGSSRFTKSPRNPALNSNYPTNGFRDLYVARHKPNSKWVMVYLTPKTSSSAPSHRHPKT